MDGAVAFAYFYVEVVAEEYALPSNFWFAMNKQGAFFREVGWLLFGVELCVLGATVMGAMVF